LPGIQAIYVNLRADEHKTPRFLALNGKVPVLVDEGAVIYKSTVVNEYLEERFPEAALMPRDPLGRAEVRLWEDYGDNALLAPAEAISIYDKGWSRGDSYRVRTEASGRRLTGENQELEYLTKGCEGGLAMLMANRSETGIFPNL
jgi:glutathione S-transferase